MKRTKIILICGICIGFLAGVVTGAKLLRNQTEAVVAAEPDFLTEETASPQESLPAAEPTTTITEPAICEPLPASSGEVILPVPVTAPESTSLPAAATQEAEERIVYIAPTGKRYHYSQSCAGKNAKAVPISEASRTRTPCLKCVK